jgi:hypothetical protein
MLVYPSKGPRDTDASPRSSVANRIETYALRILMIGKQQPASIERWAADRESVHSQQLIVPVNAAALPGQSSLS